jgi:hypothetical protein
VNFGDFRQRFTAFFFKTRRMTKMTDQNNSLLDSADPNKGGGSNGGGSNAGSKGGGTDDPNKGKSGQDPNDGGKGGQQNNDTPDALHDAAIAAVEAWQKNPTDETKDAAAKAVQKAKDAVAAARKAAEETAAKNKAPEKYEDFKLPEGVTAIPEVMDKFKATAKEMNLTQAAAQKLVDLQAEAIAKAAEASQKGFSDMQKEWREETLKVLGTDKEAKLGLVSKAIDKIGTPELRQLLKDSGLGNNKEVILFLAKVGEMVSEDGFVDGKGKGGNKTDGELFYPSMGSKK